MKSATNIVRSLVIVLVVLASAVACSTGESSGGESGSSDGGEGTIGNNFDLSGATLTVGSTDSTEELILGQITIAVLEAAGAEAKDQTGLSGTFVKRDAVVSGEIDMAWLYTGEVWANQLGHEKPIPDSQEQYQAVAEEDLKKNNIKWLTPAPFNNSYGLAVRSEAYEELGVKKMSDFPSLIEEDPSKASLCVGNEFSTRPDGLPGLEKAYGFEFPDQYVSKLDEGVIYPSIDKGKPCNFGEIFTTDGRIQSLDLRIVEDDKDFFPIYNPAPTLRQKTFEKYPQLADMFRPIALALDTETIVNLNSAVDVEGRFPEQVATEWLQEEGFIG